MHRCSFALAALFAAAAAAPAGTLRHAWQACERHEKDPRGCGAEVGCEWKGGACTAQGSTLCPRLKDPTDCNAPHVDGSDERLCMWLDHACVEFGPVPEPVSTSSWLWIGTGVLFVGGVAVLWCITSFLEALVPRIPTSVGFGAAELSMILDGSDSESVESAHDVTTRILGPTRNARLATSSVSLPI